MLKRTCWLFLFNLIIGSTHLYAGKIILKDKLIVNDLWSLTFRDQILFLKNDQTNEEFSINQNGKVKSRLFSSTGFPIVISFDGEEVSIYTDTRVSRKNYGGKLRNVMSFERSIKSTSVGTAGESPFETDVNFLTIEEGFSISTQLGKDTYVFAAAEGAIPDQDTVNISTPEEKNSPCRSSLQSRKSRGSESSGSSSGSSSSSSVREQSLEREKEHDLRETQPEFPHEKETDIASRSEQAVKQIIKKLFNGGTMNMGIGIVTEVQDNILHYRAQRLIGFEGNGQFRVLENVSETWPL